MRDLELHRRRGDRARTEPQPLRWDATKCVECGRRRNVEDLGRRRTIETPAGTMTVRVCGDVDDCRDYAARGSRHRGAIL